MGPTCSDSAGARYTWHGALRREWGRSWGGRGVGRAPVSCSERKRDNTASRAVLCCVYRGVECAGWLKVETMP